VPKDIIFSNTISLLEKSLNLRSMQHRVLASNIANMDTPNYKAFEIVVEEEINKKKRPATDVQLERTHANHIPIKTIQTPNVRLRASKPPELSLRGDGNTVDVDRTMGKLAENTLLYKAAAQLISKKLIGLRNVIKGGK
jgi:flagellar basal-body rod protein FlgB